MGHGQSTSNSRTSSAVSSTTAPSVINLSLEHTKNLDRNSQEGHWTRWVEETSFHGPKEAIRANFLLEKIIWALITIAMFGWTMYTVGVMIYIYLQEEQTFHTDAIPPTFYNIFQMLPLAYCSSDWLDVIKARSMGIEPEVMDYMRMSLEVNTGAGLSDLNLAEKMTDPGIRLKFNAEYEKLVEYKKRKRYASYRQLYEDVTKNYSTHIFKKRLCFSSDGIFCKYRFYPQFPFGYTIRQGRMCQYLQPQGDPIALTDPLQKYSRVQIAARHYIDGAHSNNISVSIQPYIGELVTTGFSNDTDFFTDQIHLTSKGVECQVRLAVSMYEIRRINTSYDRCINFFNTLLPGHYPPLTCKLRCFDKAYFVRKQNCSVYYSLYLHRRYHKEAELPVCSPVQFHDTLAKDSSVEMTNEYLKCIEEKQCDKRIPCKEYFGSLTHLSNVCKKLPKSHPYSQVLLELVPVNMMRIKHSLKISFTEIYSNIGGVMGFAMGASIISVGHLISTFIESAILYFKIKFFPKKQALPMVALQQTDIAPMPTITN